MTKFGKFKKAAPLVLAIAAGFGVSGAANAGLVATSVLEVTNFQIQNGSGMVYDISSFGSAIISDSGTNTASLSGFVTASNTLNIFGGGPMDIAQACVGGPCPLPNNFAHTTPPPAVGTQLARADSKLDGNPVTGLPGALGANARTVAETLLTGNGIGKGDSDLGLNTLFTFVLPVAQTLRFAFDADLYLRAFLSPDSKIGSSASATSKLSFNLFDGTGANIFSWQPNGVVGAIVGGTEIADGANLNDSIVAFLPGQDLSRDKPGAQSFIAETLLGPGLYTFNISHIVGATGTQVIPEPGTLLLAGIGLLGLVASRRQKKVV